MPDITFIWKYEEEGSQIAKHLPNVHLSTWVPQNALLADKRLSLFITHGGLGSSTELAYLGKPALIIPIFADQTKNGRMLERHGIAHLIHKTDLLKPEKLKEAILKVLDDPSYQENATRLADMLQNIPLDPKQLLIRHVEFAARFGKLPQLDPYGRHLNIFQYYLIDVAIFLISVILLTVFIAFYYADPIVAGLFTDEHAEEMKQMWLDSPDPIAMLSKLANFSRAFEITCGKLFATHELVDSLRKEKFDLAIVEPFNYCGFAIMEELRIPNWVAAESTTGFDLVAYYTGRPIAPSYVPGATTTMNDRMTFFERMRNVVQTLIGSYLFIMIGDNEYKVVHKTHPHIRDWRESLSESAFVLSNSNPILSFPHPTIQKYIPLGGLTVEIDRSKLELSEEWNKILNERQHTVLMSFGSVIKAKYAPDIIKESILKTFALMPDITFIWKYEDEGVTFADHLPNVHLSTWVPQNSLLADKRLSLFITHGGLGSSTELAHLGKPALIIPIFADQTKNGRMLERHGIAHIMHKKNLLKPEKLKKAILKVLNDPGYQENATRLAGMLQNIPINPKESLIKHVEFAARFGKLPQLDPYSRQLNIFQLYLIDVGIFLISVALLVFFLLYFCVKKCCCRKSTTTKSKKD
ncbi:hypothetical protein WR25_06210 [Diploscapter pachys]|uniref:glucuronosyltransferase n=1 Tax=Diploscapter pachys TaxID=2018661 RepID=A0A2A2L4D5_9BILA|nr:hypothetical protein WR25_06210 [Diploscapter pachys]